MDFKMVKQKMKSNNDGLTTNTMINIFLYGTCGLMAIAILKDIYIFLGFKLSLLTLIVISIVTVLLVNFKK